MPLDVAAITTGLTQDETGIWRSSSPSALSYPEDGHRVFRQVEQSSFWFQHRNACLAALLERWRPEGPLLDVGGGNGFVSRGLSESGIESVLLEPGPTGASNARDSGLQQVLCTTLEEARFQSGSLPAAGLFDVLEHVEDESALLGELHRVLVPGGLLALTVPAGTWLWSADDRHAGHFRRYRLLDLESRLRQNGFSNVYSGYLFSFLVAPLFLFKTLPSKFGVDSKNDDVASVEHDHDARTGLTGAVLTRMLEFERNRLAHGLRIPFGTSCIAVARRT